MTDRRGSAPEIRSVELDVLRGFAVLGIYWINVVVFGLPHGAYAEPTLLGHAAAPNIAVWAFSQLFVEGTMRGLFSMLFGASALIFLDEAKLGASGLEVVDRYYRRTLLLMLFGLIHAYLLLAEFEVLYAYGLLGIFLFPIRKLTPKVLFVAGCLLLATGDIISSEPATSPDTVDTIEVADTTDDETEADDTGDETTISEMEADIELYRSNYQAIFANQRVTVAAQQSTYMYEKHVFDIGGMMLIGMALLKWGILTGRGSGRIYLLLMLLGYGMGCVVRGYDIFRVYSSNFDPDLITQLGTITYDIGRLPATLGHVGLVGLLCKSVALAPVSRSLAGAGRLALTNYVMQTVISVILFYGFGLALFGSLERYQLVYVCVAVWLSQILFSRLWLQNYRYGPLEWMWRSLTYGKRLPLRLAAA